MSLFHRWIARLSCARSRTFALSAVAIPFAIIGGVLLGKFMTGITIGLSAHPASALTVDDLNDEQIAAVTKIWAYAVAKRYGVTLASYHPERFALHSERTDK